MGRNKILPVFFLFWVLSPVAFAQKNIEKELIWLTDLEKAKIVSQELNKPILLRFQGSDWCANCWRLDSTLFETTEFKQFVDNIFVLVALDFPSKPQNKLPEKVAKKNKEWLNIYNPSGAFPALIVLDPDGSIIGKMPVNPNPTEWYINKLEEILSKIRQ